MDSVVLRNPTLAEGNTAPNKAYFRAVSPVVAIGILSPGRSWIRRNERKLRFSFISTYRLKGLLHLPRQMKENGHFLSISGEILVTD